MDCSAKITRQRKTVLSGTSKKVEWAVEIYCPILGDLGFRGERAERIIQRIKARDDSTKARDEKRKA